MLTPLEDSGFAVIRAVNVEKLFTVRVPFIAVAPDNVAGQETLKTPELVAVKALVPPDQRLPPNSFGLVSSVG